ncbi:hypothetical protein [Terriglobus tenax]|nr:hypothetical protein [Terriglobus tenax]
MKPFVFTFATFSAAAVALLLWGPRRVKPIDELAHQLETAWHDHHTSAV